MAVLDETQQQSEGVSKSAKRRAAKKARDAAAAETAAPAPEPPAPEPKAKAKSKAKAKAEPAPAAAAPPAPAPAPAPAAKAEAKAKAKGKAKAKAEPEPPAAAAAAKAKAKPAPEQPKAAAPKAAAAAAAPKAAAAKPAAKPAAQKGKAPAKVEEEEPQPKESTELSANWIIDDGSGPAWEVSSGMTKKQQKRKERVEEEKAMAKAGPVGKAVPGMGPVNTIPGMAPAGADKGVSQSVAADVDRILAMKSAAAVEEKAPEGNSSTATVHVPESRIGIVIGPKGSKIKMIQEKTGVTRIDTTGEVFTIMGPPQAVAQAEAAVKELVEKGYCALSYDDFAENFVNVHPSCFPDLIGKNGAVVRKIKEELGVEVNFPETQKNAPAAKKYKVTLAGGAQAVEKARAVINNIMMYSHDELTHPGTVHEELEIESWAWRYIIGTAGSEMKHIQNNYKVKVNIPREHSLNQQVLVVGERDAVSRAKAYIEKLVWNAEHRTTGRDKVDNGDVWGDEEEEEEWMKQYMYKR